jgi:hypothetical protein
VFVLKRNRLAFEAYQQQAVEDILGYRISPATFHKARRRAEKSTAISMQRRIELIASAVSDVMREKEG